MFGESDVDGDADAADEDAGVAAGAAAEDAGVAAGDAGVGGATGRTAAAGGDARVTTWLSRAVTGPASVSPPAPRVTSGADAEGAPANGGGSATAGRSARSRPDCSTNVTPNRARPSTTSSTKLTRTAPRFGGFRGTSRSPEAMI